jgi:hypothetical protein
MSPRDLNNLVVLALLVWGWTPAIVFVGWELRALWRGR